MTSIKIGSLGKNSGRKVREFNKKNWLDSYVHLYPTIDFTLYMHILVNQISDVLSMYGRLSQFTEQRLGKINDIASKWYFCSTAFDQEVVLKKVIQKQNRIQKLDMMIDISKFYPK